MKILISDFDNTLYTNNFKKNILKVNEFVKCGNMFILASGRSINDLQKGMNGVNILYSYLICNDGGMIFDKDLKLIKRTDINNEDLKIFSELDSDKLMGETFIDTGYKLSKIISKENNTIVSRIKNLDYTFEKLKHIIMNYPNVEAYISDNWLNISNISINKGIAINFLEKHLNLNHNDIYTIGDGINDISMNKIYNSYAVSNGNVELKNNSKKVVLDIIEAINDIKE